MITAMNSHEEVSVAQRIPGQAVMTALLTAREQDPPRSVLGRLFGADPLGDGSRRWYQGALGEIEVGKVLARLGPRWTVLHAVPVGSGGTDIDHVVIGPGGVFTINTKHHAGKTVWVAGETLLVSGQKQVHVRNSSREAARACKMLSKAAGLEVTAAGVVAIVGAKSLTIKQEAAGTTVLAAPNLRRWLEGRPAVLSDGEAARIAAAAAKAETWHSAPVDGGDPAAVLASFNGIRTIVQAARRRRRAWGIAGMSAVAAGAAMGALYLGPALLDALPRILAG